MKKMILIAGASLALAVAQAQPDKNYLPGYIVKINGDTLRGSIRYRRWDKNPRSIVFSWEGRQVDYHPGAIRAFFVADEHYESGVVDVDTSPVQLRDLTENREPVFVRDTVFLQSLFRGQKNLLYLKDQDGKEHFYIDDDGFKPLVYKRFIRVFESMEGLIRKFTEENKDYQKQLFFYLTGCPAIQRKIEASSYQASSLTRLFSDYHACIAKPVKYRNSRKYLELQTGVLAGTTLSSLHFSGDPNVFDYLIEPGYTASTTIAFGFFADLKLLRLERVKLVNEFLLSSFDIRGDGVTRKRDMVTSRFSYQFLKIHNLVQFNILSNGALHVQAGVSSAAVLKQDYSIHIVNFTGSPSDRAFKSRKVEFGAIGGLGTDFKSITAEVRYEMSTGLSAFPGVTATAKRGSIILKYRFFKK